MKALFFIVLSCSSLAQAQTLREFKVTGPLITVDRIDKTVQAQEDAMKEAWTLAIGECELQCKGCGLPSYEILVQDYWDSLSTYRFQYSASVSSTNCETDSKPKRKFMESQECGTTRAGTQQFQLTPGTLEDNRTPPAEQRGDARSKIPGDGDGTGRRRD